MRISHLLAIVALLLASCSNPPVPVTSAEHEREGASCQSDQDCTGRLRCVSYRNIAGREVHQCLFTCGDGCPSGYDCAPDIVDGPKNTCVPRP
jgi:hypothetical protein